MKNAQEEDLQFASYQEVPPFNDVVNCTLKSRRCHQLRSI
jgi:hypothetical protein